MDELEKIAAVAVEAAEKAGAIQKEKYGGILNVDAKYADDIKLEADRLCEKAILDTIRSAFPNHAVLAEESGATGDGDHIWCIDPLDGTVNFYHGIPYFCTVIACYSRKGADADPAGLGTPLVGVTYAPMTDDMFVGVVGRGATLNGKPVRIREEPEFSESFIITSFGNNPDNLAFTRNVTLDLCLKVRKTRNLGACALDLAYVAAGRASGFIEYGVNAWDMAAGRALVEAAGGRFATRKTKNNKLAIAAAGNNIFPTLVEALDRMETYPV